MRIFSLLIAFVFLGCNTPQKIPLQNNFTFSKAYVELSYITKDKTELQQLLEIIESNKTPSKKFTEWSSKFEDEVKIRVLKRYISEGHRGL